MNTFRLLAGAPGPTVHPDVYGHFAEHLGRCIYEGLWVGEESDIPHTRGLRNDVVAALRAIDIPVLRWPGGCFADEYHWRDGIGPRAERPSMINTHWGRVVENNHFGTHEFFELVHQLGCRSYVCGNVGSGTPREMMEWVEYMTSDTDSPLANLRRANGRDKPWRLDHFGVGNESWGCGGNMRPEYYADLYRRYNTFVKDYGDLHVGRVAGGANSDDYAWTEVLMERAARFMDGLSLHYYTLPSGSWMPKGPATGFGVDAYRATLERAMVMDTLLTRHGAIMDKHDPARRISLVVDEWGIWTDPEPGTNPGFLYQQNSIRDAILAGLTFHLFHKHAARVRMANIAQTVNVLQAMVLTEGPRMLRTPTYWVFEMLKGHQGGTVLPLTAALEERLPGAPAVPLVSVSATRRGESGPVTISVVNSDPAKGREVVIDLAGIPADRRTARVLTAPTVDSHNTFDEPDRVSPVPLATRLVAGSLALEMPACGVATVTLG